MFMREELAEDKLLVQSYGEGGFRVGGTRIEGAMVIGEKFADSIKINSIAELETKHMQEILKLAEKHEQNIDVILFGGGKKTEIPASALVKWLRKENIAFDMMDTGAAARTYNVLQSENRRAMAIMLPVD